MFDNSKFDVHLSIERVTRIPYSNGTLYVNWNVVDSPRPDAHGRTASRGIHNTEAVFNETVTFKQRIGLRNPSRYLRSCPVKFEVIWKPVGGRGVTIGNLSLDLSQFVRRSEKRDNWSAYSMLRTAESKHEKNEHVNSDSGLKHDSEGVGKDGSHAGEHVYDRSLLYLLGGARSNCLLELRIKLDNIAGNTDFKIPVFDGPAMNLISGEDAEGDQDLEANLRGSRQGREKLRRLKKAVFDQLMHEDNSHSKAESNWLDLDALLEGKHVSVQSKELEEELERYGVREVGADSSYENHERGSPFLETDIRENFINWNVMGS